MVTNSTCFIRVSVAALLVAVLGGTAMTRLSAPRRRRTKVLGLDKVIAFAYSPTKGFDPKQLRSVTFFGPTDPDAWRYWQTRKVVTGVVRTWMDLLRPPIDKAVENLVGMNYGGNPRPVVMIDEFGGKTALAGRNGLETRRCILSCAGAERSISRVLAPIPRGLSHAGYEPEREHHSRRRATSQSRSRAGGSGDVRS